MRSQIRDVEFLRRCNSRSNWKMGNKIHFNLLVIAIWMSPICTWPRARCSNGICSLKKMKICMTKPEILLEWFIWKNRDVKCLLCYFRSIYKQQISAIFMYGIHSRLQLTAKITKKCIICAPLLEKGLCMFEKNGIEAAGKHLRK